jgi:hypothetical protein
MWLKRRLPSSANETQLNPQKAEHKLKGIRAPARESDGKPGTGSCEEVGRERLDNAIAKMMSARTLHV